MAPGTVNQPFPGMPTRLSQTWLPTLLPMLLPTLLPNPLA